MLRYTGRSQPDEAEGWSPRDERTVIDNVACMLPPNLDQDLVHYFLLRFQLEEDEYYLQNLTDESKYIKYYDSDFLDGPDTKLRGAYPPDVRIRYKLIQDKSKIIESILQVYPPFIYSSDGCTPNIEFCQEAKEIYLNSSDQISIIIGDDGQNIKNIEQEFNVKISLSDVPDSLKDAPNSIYKDCLCKLLIKGNSKERISECFQHIQNILKSKESYDFLRSQTKKASENDNEDIIAAPWEMDKNDNQQQDEEEDKEENDLYGLNSLLKNKENEYLSMLSKQGPPGS